MELAADDHPARQAFRAWHEAHPDPSPRELAESGYVAPHWPEPYGLGAGPLEQLIIDEELDRAGVARPQNQIGIGWAGPTILHAGTEEQKQRYLLPLLAGEEIWCQMFSEPGAGSDLAGLSTRAERDGDVYRVNGQKIWTSGAHNSQFGILIARTDPDSKKQNGISYFICPTDLPGIEMRPIIDMTTAYSFNEVFFTDVELPAENLVGEENGGWRLAKVTLANERVSLSTGGVLWGMGPRTNDLIDLVRANGGTDDPILRQRLADVWIEGQVLDLIRQRTLMARLAGKQPGPEASIRKILADEHGQKVMALAKDLAGAAGMIEGSGPGSGGRTRTPRGDDTWHWGYLFSQALTIGGGTGEVQRNIVGEKVLGLPKEPDVERGLSWREAQHR
jgi:alkylation response protein AidB-like acyl-CoA dehydrogenase